MYVLLYSVKNETFQDEISHNEITSSVSPKYLKKYAKEFILSAELQ